MIDRRAVLVGMLGVGAASSSATAQSSRAAKIGYLHPTTIDPDHLTLRLLRKVWLERGYVEGVTVLVRSADGDNARLPRLVDELIGEGVGVLIVVGAAALKVASRATRVVPIVAIDLETDPVLEGYAASVSRPGGNITGLFLDQPSLAGKWIQLLREAAPSIRRLALIWDRTTGRHQLDSAQAAAREMRIDTMVVEARPASEYDAVLGDLAKDTSLGLVQLTAPGTAPTFADLSRAAIAHRVPSITFQKINVRQGALLGYGASQEDFYPRAVAMADRILKGAKVADMPIQRPTSFELVVNLRTAKALGLTLPTSLLVRADELIE